MMARTKMTARKSTGGKSCGNRRFLIRSCYDVNRDLVPPRPVGERYNLRSVGRRQRSVAVMKTAKLAEFPMFVMLPQELQTTIWQMIANMRRIVSIHISASGEIWSAIPPLLHVCSESRAIGLRGYRRLLSAIILTPDIQSHVYFNFDRDVLYLGPDWNKNATGRYSCLGNGLQSLHMQDLGRIKEACFDLNMSACVYRSTASHMPWLLYWGLERLYLGLRQGGRQSDTHLEICELESEAWPVFVKTYRQNPTFLTVSEEFDDADAFGYIKADWKRYYNPLHDTPGGVFKGDICAVKLVEL